MVDPLSDIVRQLDDIEESLRRINQVPAHTFRTISVNVTHHLTISQVANLLALHEERTGKSISNTSKLAVIRRIREELAYRSARGIPIPRDRERRHTHAARLYFGIETDWSTL